MPAIAHLALNDEGFVFNPLTGDSYQTCPTGLRILQYLREGADDEAVIRRLTDEFEVTPDAARRDWMDFKGALQTHGLM